MKKNGTLGIIIALSVAMLGATVVVSLGVLQAEALKSGTSVLWCYGQENNETPCFPNHGECVKAQERDTSITSGCFKFKLG